MAKANAFCFPAKAGTSGGRALPSALEVAECGLRPPPSRGRTPGGGGGVSRSTPGGGAGVCPFEGLVVHRDAILVAGQAHGGALVLGIEGDP